MKDSSFGRVVGALVSPGATFRSIAERPTWVAPFVVLLLLAFAVGVVIQLKTDPEEMVRQQMAMMKVEVPQEQMDKMIDDAENRGTGAKVGFTILGVVVQAAIYALVALLFWVGFKLFGSEMDFMGSFATALHAYMPLALGSLLNLPVMLTRASLTFEEVSSGGVLVSSLKAFAPEDASRVTESLLGSFDLFTIWTLILLVIGYRAVAKVSTAVASGLVILYWLVYVGGKLALTAAFIR
ncbi:MAG TPA: YIP1 family protein [Thermoanaerobaculia bacterium]|nr:YIP1 family protein [Thermoanaerobaculia bacterium]